MRIQRDEHYEREVMRYDDREWSSTRSKENGAEATEEIMAKNFPESMKRHQSESP